MQSKCRVAERRVVTAAEFRRSVCKGEASFLQPLLGGAHLTRVEPGCDGNRGGVAFGAMDETDQPLTIKFVRVGDWWTATVETPDGTIVGSGPTRELARVDWLLLNRAKAPPDRNS